MARHRKVTSADIKVRRTEYPTAMSAKPSAFSYTGIDGREYRCVRVRDGVYQLKWIGGVR